MKRFLWPLVVFNERHVWTALRSWGAATVWGLRWIIGARVSFEGLENVPQGGALIAMKHQSTLDTIVPALFIPRPVYVFKKELGNVPVIQSFTRIETEQTWLGRTRIVAEGSQGQREIIVNPNTGEILRDLPSGEDPEQFVLHPDDIHLYIANEDDAITTVVNTQTGERRQLKQQPVPGYDASKYVTERVWAPARDGRTKIPVTLVYKKGVQRNGKAPLLQYAYGSYGAFSEAMQTAGPKFGEAWNELNNIEGIGEVVAEIGQAMRGGQHQIIGDQRPGAKAAVTQFDAAHGLPSLALVAGLKGPHHGPIGQRGRSGQQQAVAECCHTIAKELHNFPMMMT